MRNNCKSLTETELVQLIVNNSNLHRAYEDFVDRKMCKIIIAHRKLLNGFDIELRIGNVFVNYVKYESDNLWETLSEYQWVVDKIKHVCDLGWVYVSSLNHCIKLSEKNSNLLFHYAKKLVEEFSWAMSGLCDEFEGRLISFEEKDIDEIPTEYLDEFIKTKSWGKGKIQIIQN